PGLSEAELHALQAGLHDNPFSILGPHDVGGRTALRVYAPGAQAVRAVLPDGTECPLAAQAHGLYAAYVPALRPGDPGGYRLSIRRDGHEETLADPYAFGALLDEHALQDLAAGAWQHVAGTLGA